MRSRATDLWLSLASLAPGNRASPSTRSTPKDSGAMLRVSLPMRASFSARWRSPTLTSLMVSRRRSRLIRRAHRAIHAPPWERSPRSGTTCDSSTRVRARRTVRSAIVRSVAFRSTTSLTRSCSSPTGRASSSSAPSSATVRVRGDLLSCRTEGGLQSRARQRDALRP